MEKTNIEMLKWGLTHIANNHGINACVDELEEEGVVCVWTSDKPINVPTISDTQMLCEDLGIDKDCIDVSEYGIDIFPTQEWYDTKGKEEYKGMGFWKKVC